MAQPSLGILTLYLNDDRLLEERLVYQKMITAGRKLGLDCFVFTPQDVNYQQNRIHAMLYDPVTKVWSRKWRRFPHMIYDRCRIQRSHRFEQLLRFRAKYGHLTFLNRPLRNKWTVYKTLSREARFRPHLPFTKIVENSNDLREMIGKYPLLYLKPINGTGGRGILRIERKPQKLWLIQGRDHSRRIIKPEMVSSSQLLQKLAAWEMKNHRYVIQQGIHIKLPNGRVHDYRMLVQKNAQGKWELTGCAGRVGAPGSITSNLHGGGKAASMHSLLSRWIRDEAKVDQIEKEASELGVQIAEFLESSYSDLCELALDLAIDQNGRIWLLEVNPKPAREVFARAGEHNTYRKAIIRPLEYALWLHRQKSRIKEEEEDPSSS
ncbi:YheC/YheD family endospore coat-associated protein [Paenibacillus abyssi]|uniref:Endospore coat-associated protein YheC n=1 Tax=Paenibacillus abyssi TaxID=1340531 RepID=A0A917LII0_9BACL|nr:YheC/YheD family protein [Paenibacillus abyssi]GGG26583.1 endospore coat-associated protein YheC [Paenibacillus abyssi]